MIPPVLHVAQKTDGFFARRVYGQHGGNDYTNKIKDRRVVACDDGVVTHFDFSLRARVGTMCGQTLEIKLSNGVAMKLCHLSKRYVELGQKVHKGMLIAEYGNTGTLSFGAHCHVEIRKNGSLINPDILIDEPAIHSPIPKPQDNKLMQTFEPAIQELYWNFLWRGITEPELYALRKSSRDQAAYERQRKNILDSPERREALELLYKSEINRTGKSGYGKVWVDAQVRNGSLISRATKDLVDRRKEIKDMYKK